MLALARYINRGTKMSNAVASPNQILAKEQFQTDVDVWLDAMTKVVNDRAVEQGKLG